jgi:hypothetical protein
MLRTSLPLFFFIAFLTINATAQQHTKKPAQDTTADLMKQLENDSSGNKTVYATATFKTTRLINGHSVEVTKPGVLDVRIDHRFGYISGGAYQFFGLDQANVRIGFDYGLSKSVMIGIGHTANQKVYDAFFKWKILRQSTGEVNMPVTVDFVPTIAINTLDSSDLNIGKKINFSDRVSLANVLVIGRKFSDNLSLQITPAYILKDKAFFSTLHNNEFAIGIGGRQKLSKHTSFNAEYYYQVSGQEPGTSNVFSIGVDIETGGHVFQIHLTNTQGMTDNAFITQTTGKWSKGNIGLGFNLSRVFNVSKKSKAGW